MFHMGSKPCRPRLMLRSNPVLHCPWIAPFTSGQIHDYVGLDRGVDPDEALHRAVLAQTWARTRKLDLSMKPLSTSRFSHTGYKYPELGTRVKAARTRVLFEFVTKMALDIATCLISGHPCPGAPQAGWQALHQKRGSRKCRGDTHQVNVNIWAWMDVGYTLGWATRFHAMTNFPKSPNKYWCLILTLLLCWCLNPHWLRVSGLNVGYTTLTDTFLGVAS